MKKECKSYKYNAKNSYISSKNFLVAQGAIDKYLNILDLNGFRKEVVELTKLAKNKHNVDKGLLFGERTIYSADKSYFQAVPNKDAFSEIDKVKKTAQPQAQSQEDLDDFYMGDEPLRFQEEKALSEDITYLNPVEAVEQKIESELPSEVAKSVTVLNNVPQDILGRDDLFLSLKDILNDNGITDELLINWAGVNKDRMQSPKTIKSTEQLLNIIQNNLEKKKKEDQYLEFKINPIAAKSFKEWVKALEKYPLPFQDVMLSHAIKHITNPQRKSKYVLQLSEVALTNAHGIVVNKPYELNRIGKLYDQEVLATVSDAVDHEPSASGKGYWVHVPRTENKKAQKSLYVSTYNTYKEFLEKSKERVKELKETIEKQEKIKEKKPVFSTQEPNLSKEDASKYGFKDFTFVRVESTYSRWDKNVTPKLYLRNQPHIKELGEDYEGYYIHGYNWDGRESKATTTKILPITREQAEELWQAEIDRHPNNPEVGYSVEDRQELYRLNDNKKSLKYLEEAIKTLKPEEWDIKEDNTFKVNVDLLRKLSPSTWCTASSMTEHYVENYDNYLLIVNGVTVAGIEASPDFTINGHIRVKEVTSRANNGIAPIDHLDDIIAFFEKHNLDLDNPTIKRAIKAKAEGKVDQDYIRVDNPADRYYEPFDPEEDYYIEAGYYPEENYYEPDDEDLLYAEMEREQREWQAEINLVNSITTEAEARQNRSIVNRHFQDLSPALRVFEDVATAAVNYDSHNIAHVDSTLPFYNELATRAVRRNPYVFTYLSPEAKETPGLREIYDEYERNRQLDDDLPFSKTNAKLIQGYYDPKTDKVVVIASNTPVNDASKVAIHEVAHRGMLRMAKELGGVKELGKALFAAEDQLMKKLPELLKRTGHKNLESLLEDYGFTKNSEEGRIKLLMELAARWAETLVNKPKPSWWKEFLKSIKNWIAKFTGVILDEKEVDELVGGFVKYGTGDSAKDIPVSTPETTQNQELFLYLSKEMSDKLGYNNPGSTAAPSIKDIITRIPVINQTDIDNKKLEC